MRAYKNIKICFLIYSIAVRVACLLLALTISVRAQITNNDLSTKTGAVQSTCPQQSVEHTNFMYRLFFLCFKTPLPSYIIFKERYPVKSSLVIFLAILHTQTHFSAFHKYSHTHTHVRWQSSRVAYERYGKPKIYAYTK